MLENKTEYTPSEALDCLNNVSKNALYNDMNNGSISYEEKQWGKKTRRIIQGIELARFYKEKFSPLNTTETTQNDLKKQDETLQGNVKTHLENSVLEQRIELLNEQLKSKDALLNEVINSRDDLSKKLDAAQQTLQSQTLLLEDQRKKKEASEVTESTPEPRKRFLGIF